MTNKYVVACDESPASDRALQFAIDEASSSGASILIVHVLEWSPYSFLTPEEIEERHKRRSEELQRAQSALVDGLVARVAAAGIEVDSMIRYGHVAKVIAEIAGQEKASQLFIGRTGDGGISARVFGSVASTTAQIAPVPCTIVP